MKTKLIVSNHILRPDDEIIEIWYDGKFLGTIYGRDGPGIRVISKFPMESVIVNSMITEVKIGE